MYYINKDKCICCRDCIINCPTCAIDEKDGKIILDVYNCIDCGLCKDNCLFEAI